MTASLRYSFSPLGDEAVLVDYGNVIDERINGEVHRVFRRLKKASILGIRDIVPAYSSLAVFYDVAYFHQQTTDDETAFDVVVQAIVAHMTGTETDNGVPGRQVRVPVCYEPPYAMDLGEYGQQKNLSPGEVIRHHTSVTYKVYMIGFVPGFAYMGTVPESLALPRKESPRASVPAGSVGIAGRQTGIYPIVSPGGWQIIGRTPLSLFSPYRTEPVLFEPGDEVVFYPITAHEFTNYQDRAM